MDRENLNIHRARKTVASVLRRYSRSPRLLATGIATLLVAAAVIWFLFLDKPRQPASWSLIKAGMPRQEVLRLLGPPTIDMLELKGFEIWSVEPASKDWYYQLQLTYDRDDGVRDAYVHLVYRNFGLKNEVRQLAGEDQASTH